MNKYTYAYRRDNKEILEIEANCISVADEILSILTGHKPYDPEIVVYENGEILSRPQAC